MKYTHEDAGKQCPHCRGRIEGYSDGEGIYYWCNTCGGNNSERPPNVVLTYSDGRTEGEVIRNN